MAQPCLSSSVTVRKLQSPDVWVRVIELADALEISGFIDDGIEAFLPIPEPGWPPARVKAVVN
jgi:hypothetical protein